jgi:cephalosporin hydroxylase
MGDEPGPWRRSRTRKVVLIAAIVVLVVFWGWALFFASKEAVNKIGDEAWSERAEAICAEYDIELQTIEARREAAPEARAALVIQSTDLMSDMLDEVVVVMPTDEKGQAIVPDWEADYRTLLADRYAYAERLSAGENVPFTETAVDGVPITERIETFAGDNAMPSCAPPRGSII